MIQRRSESPLRFGTLTIAVGPAGDVADVAARLGAALADARLIAAPDAGRLRAIAASLRLALAGRVVSLTGSAPPGPVPELLAELRAGQDVLLVTDAPPGATDETVRDLIMAAAVAGIGVTSLPGPSPVTAALAVAGLAAERFVFEGTLSRRAGAREHQLAELAAERRTMIFSESAARLAQTLAELAAAFGTSRAAVLCWGLATGDQDVQRGSLGALAGRAEGGALRSGQGEVMIVVAGAPARDAAAAASTEPDALAEAVRQVRAHVGDGSTTRDAVAAVAVQTGLRRRDLYNAVGRAGPAAAGPGEHEGP
jgi:16S rRNA (cytidine1402-2'-O)-methyltransferase